MEDQSNPNTSTDQPETRKIKGTPTSSKREFAKMPVGRDSEVYNMNHKNRGVAIIFNHKNFHKELMDTRHGTDVDCENLTKVFENLNFKVKAFHDLKKKQLIDEIETVRIMNHADNDCLVIVVLSHGDMEFLYAADQRYNPENLWAPFSSDSCQTLAGKPKLFFIQACQGPENDPGLMLKKGSIRRVETDSNPRSYKIPIKADFLIAFSTLPGFCSWRSTSKGSWFVQSLCSELRESAEKLDLLSIMTRVSRRVALDYTSNTPKSLLTHESKQIPQVISMLTRDVYFCNNKKQSLLEKLKSFFWN